MTRARQKKPCEWCGTEGLLYKPFTRFCSRSCSMFARTHARGGDVAVGTKKTLPNGYVMVKVSVRPSVWVQEHRLVMADKLGRELDPSERVHHMNGKRGDNQPSNLELWTLDHKDPPGVRVRDVHGAGGNWAGLLFL